MSVKVLYEKQEPKIYMMPNAAYKMRYYIDNSKDEIGWLGFVRKEDNNYIIEDVFLMKQKVHAATTEIDAEGLANLAVELMKTEEGREKYNKLRLWGHSHVNMSTGASSQDDRQMEDFATADYFIRLIGNKKGEWNVCLYDYENNVLWSELPLYYHMDITVSNEDLDKEIKDNVSKLTYNTGFDTTVSRGYPHYGRGYYNSLYYNEEEVEEELFKGKEEKDKEKKLEPYTIKWKPIEDDIKYITEYYAKDKESLLSIVSGDVTMLAEFIEEDFGISDMELETVQRIYRELCDIWCGKDVQE